MVEDEVRSGLRGSWDRFVGPGQSTVERAGMAVATLVGASWGARGVPAGSGPLQRTVLSLTAADLWGGAWVNNTRTCVRWYERPGQGVAAHVGFAALHVAHAGAVGWVDATTGTRTPGSAVRWSMAHYAWMFAAATTIISSPRPARLPLALAATAVGVGLDRALGPSPSAPWFAPIYTSKLLVGHAAGSIWKRHPTA